MIITVQFKASAEMIRSESSDQEEKVPICCRRSGSSANEQLMAVSCPKWDHKNWRDSLEKMLALYGSIFRSAADADAEELYMPILGEASELVPVHRSVEALWDAACRSDFDGRCVVMIAKHPSPSFNNPYYKFIQGFEGVYFERPKQDVFLRTGGDSITPSDLLLTAAKGTARDPSFDPQRDMRMEKGVFVSPERTWQAAAASGDSLAKNLYAVMHDLYFVPQAFVMNLCGTLPDGRMVVIFRTLSQLSAHAPGVSDASYEKDTFFVCRFPEASGSISMNIPALSRKIELIFFTANDLKDAYEGCIVGGAAGDALGYPVEFLTFDRIRQYYGPKGIQTFSLTGGVAEFSDDTQMTLFTVDGLRQGICRAEAKGISAKPEVYISWAYQDWLRTQYGKESRYSGFTDLFREEPGLYAWRAPGNTCLSALTAQRKNTPNPPYSIKPNSIENPANQSRGCGGVMRVAPVGLMLSSNHWLGRDGAARTAAEAAAVTHGHPLGYLPAAFLGELIHRIVYKMDGSLPLREIIERTRAEVNREFAETNGIRAFDAILDKAFRLANDQNYLQMKDRTDADVLNIHAIGGGWVGDEALAIALYCVIRFPLDFQQALRLAVNHSGDSDSTGAIAGNILGAYLGLAEIKRQIRCTPAEEHPIHLEQLELYDRLLYWTDAAFNAVKETSVKKEAGDTGSRDLIYLYISSGIFYRIDRTKKTAYFWPDNESKWIEHPSIFAEYEWGEPLGHPAKLLEL